MNNKGKRLIQHIEKLLLLNNEITIREIARSGNYSVAPDSADRKAIQRALKTLEDRGEIKAKGEGRSRVYQKISTSVEEIDNQTLFQDIPLDADARKALTYVSKPLSGRKPVGYIQEFLRKYQPNKTSYLSTSHRKKLLELGTGEPVIQPAGTYARNIYTRLLTDLSWNSSRLEGNTYSLLETKRLIEAGESAAGKDFTEAQMILNHKAAIEFIVDAAAEPTISVHDICSVHALLSDNLLGDPGASGRIRSIEVFIGGTTYLPLANPHLLKELLVEFVSKFNRIEDPFEQSLFALIHISYLQVFEDVNKRTARLTANIPFVKGNLRPLSFVDVTQEAFVKSLLAVYELNDISLIRDLFLWAYERSSLKYTAVQKSLGAPTILQLKYRTTVKDIVRSIILDKTHPSQIVQKVEDALEETVPKSDQAEVFKMIELDIANLHEGNIARFKIKPSEYNAWKKLNI